MDSSINTSRQADPAWMDAAEAAALLQVSRPTLYAYVSRGFIRSQPAPASPRERRYSRDDVVRLRRRTEERRAPDKAAARTLQWGLPVLESAITLIDGRRMYYRGLDVERLAESRTLEEIASLIWTGALDATSPTPLPPTKRLPAPPRDLPFPGRAQTLLAHAAARDRLSMDLRPAGVARTGFQILRLLVEAALGASPRDADGGAASALARAWRVGPRGHHVLRAALVLCADHELNVSAFAARCIASAGSSPYAVVIGGLAALEGPRHGGAGARVAAMVSSMRRVRRLDAALTARIRRGEAVEGFDHPLYPEGDPRARLLLAMLAERYRASTERRFLESFTRAAANATGARPNLDFALAALARVLGLHADAPLTIFAIGRSVGWIGQAIEQYEHGHLIRPRAKYVGVPPADLR